MDFPSFFLRTDGPFGDDYVVTGGEGSFYFAAQYLDDRIQSPLSLSTINIDVSDFTDLTLKILFAEDDIGGIQSWDSGDYVRVYASVGNVGSEELIFAIIGGNNITIPPKVDTDLTALEMVRKSQVISKNL